MLPASSAELSQGSINAVGDFEVTTNSAASSDTVIVVDNVTASTSHSDVSLSTTYCIPPRFCGHISGLINTHLCHQRGVHRRRRTALLRLSSYRMNQNESIALRNRTVSHEEQNTQAIESQVQSNYRNLDKRHNGNEIENENNNLNIQSLASSQSNTCINDRLTPTSIGDDIIPYNTPEIMTNTQLPLSPAAELRFNLNNITTSTISNTCSINENKNYILPSTSFNSVEKTLKENQISRQKQMHKWYSYENTTTEIISVTKLANKLIKLSRCLKTPNFDDLSCLNCMRLPVAPVTGKCGHTRCMRCTTIHKICPCGCKGPDKPNENIELREIINKIRFVKRLKSPKNQLLKTQGDKLSSTMQLNMRLHQKKASRELSHQILHPRAVMSTQTRYKKSCELIFAGLYIDAATHLARVAASSEPCARFARRLLHKTLTLIYKNRTQNDLSRQLKLLIREQSLQSWLSPSDLECVLCTNPYREPVSTPCGHTFCRCCIERTMYYRRKCALCSGPLEDFNLAETSDNRFFSALLKCMDIPSLTFEPDIIPIVISYVTFPKLACPLFIKNVRHWQMVLRVLKTGSRRFGMLSYERDHPLADYGMVLEICDCIVFEDNTCIVSTVGISRFQVIERDVRDGCDVARIRLLKDNTPTKEELIYILMLTEKIAGKMLTWLENMKRAIRDEIETAFGMWPIWQESQREWWNTPDGPVWLWWIIAILPLTKEAKVHILSTQSLLTRMLAVCRVFEEMDL